MSNITYSYGTREDIPRVIALGDTWWKDSSFYKNTGMEFNPNASMYYQQYDMDCLFMVVGKLPTGEMVSCYVAVITPYMFNDKYSMANEVVWCIHKDYRKGREVFKLIDAIELALTSSGINLHNLNLPYEEGKEHLADYLVKKKGYFKQDICLMKERK